ncbi:MAG: hypothetical protein CL678_17115 [Bdellovibrionaceae bacterium]|nr:hypothetical protein [Pseudobdellovibrionaceae bacterium]|tara:strand:+ start:461 stop:988 length:528 start_codon:yes stop_codon:yes gene_type:complete
MNGISSFFVILLTVIGLSVVSYQWVIEKKIKEQLQLDQCIQEKAYLLQKSISEIEQLNTGIEIIRKFIAISVIEPRTFTLLKRSTRFLAGIQKIKIHLFQARKLIWMSPFHCQNKHLEWKKIPQIPYQSLPSDWRGVQPMKLKTNIIQLEVRHLYATSKINGKFNGNEWKYRWSQ